MNVKHLSKCQLCATSQTADFISIICKVWKIFNINTPNKGLLLKDEFSNPLSYNDTRFSFLKRVIDWLECWKSIPEKNGKLSPQTFTSFRHSCVTLSLIVNHLTQHCGFSYVLSSFLQNDPLEHHFGLYRMMSGAQYHISYCQLLQTERRLKISSILNIFSKKSSESQPSLKEFLDTCSCSLAFESEPHTSFNLDLHFSVFEEYSEIELSTPILQSLSFIAGYAVHTFYRRSCKCQTCLSFLTEEKDMDIEEPPDSKYKFIQVVDRFTKMTKQLYPGSNSILEAIVTLWKVLSTIVLNDADLHNSFISCLSRNILVSITTSIIENEHSEQWRSFVVCVVHSGGIYYPFVYFKLHSFQ